MQDYETPSRISVLDRSPAAEGGTHASALRRTVSTAAELESLGYHRVWVSEHHSVPGIAGSAPTVLAAAIGAATSTIRIGTGGVMLPNHRPLVVAEQFGVLESLFPGRVDMGLGRSVGFTGGVRRALGHGKDDAEEFADQVRELLGYLSGDQRVHPGVHAFPGEGLRIPAFVLATGAGADLAAELGLPLVIAAVRGEQALADAVGRYRERFRPSAGLPAPYVVLSTAVAVGETADDAWRLLVPEAWSSAYSRTHGVFPPLKPAGDVLASTMTDAERRRFDQALGGQVFGTADQVGTELARRTALTGADEILVTTGAVDRDALLDSYRRLAVVTGIGVPAAAR
ncbi:LLM class flavin-dependent oxidoreductase [Amycolatopsis minnesotensis]|uniref:LLM class flavin-dependent oxidoreductase n=1 Tax=Amycolatopsis minnesotensis TaxID=337894 RepID=A0ABN2Q5P8_9PSEU